MKLNIIHLDMDAFYASVEEKDNPKLRGLPVIVGGLNNHGIVTTANYEARKYGVHSAMPIFIAKSKCPKGCYVPVRMERYKEVSNQVFEILYGITDLVEPLSIDEAYLDVSNIDLEPIRIAEIIRERVLRETGLTLSIGISYNKFLAKIASDWNKPNGLKIITQDMIPEILLPLPVKSVYGIGKKSTKRLNDLGIFSVEDLINLPEEFLVDLFGKSGKEVYDRIRGIDNRKINITRERKSLGVERTFEDTNDIILLKSYLFNFSKEIEEGLSRRGLQGRTITLKIKDKDFIQHTKSKSLNNFIYTSKEIYEIASNLLDEFSINNQLRLIGLTISNLMSMELVQLSLFD